ncbi:MAG: OB-fold nucleic acid binding domain-containing protein, partial [Bacteroidota bacterium]|nr:OB-fold nucleic acid binding domain-containing protein [Bacteroidota bacterium]
GKKKIEYFLPEMEEYLSETYGITVYQEQVMLLSRKLAGFTRGQADTLRKAMGKKKMDLINKLRPLFVKGCAENDIPEDKALKIWKDWEAFGSYAFNKSHSTCYAQLAYQTGYLKAHYPAQYMAAVLSRNFSDISKVSIYMDDCKYHSIDVLGPEVNESRNKFIVNKKGQIRFGLSAVRGLGEGPVDSIIEERDKNGSFKDVYDFVERVNLNSVNKRVLEALVLSGAFDTMSNFKRSDYFKNVEGNGTFIEALLKYGSKMQQENDPNQASLFGDSLDSMIQIKRPEPMAGGEEWSEIEILNKEKEYIGIYLSNHPLSKQKHIIETITTTNLSQLNDLKKHKGKEVRIAGLVTEVQHRFTKHGKPWGSLSIEDFSGVFKIALFSKSYIEYKNFLEKGFKLYIRGRVEERYNNPNEVQFQVTDMKLLDDMELKSLAIKLKVDDIKDDLIKKLNSEFDKHKGESQLKFLIYDPKTKIWVQMASKNVKIDIDDELINFLKTENLPYKLY